MEAKLDPRSPEQLVNLDDYPITSRDSKEYKSLLENLRTAIESTGSASLPDFLTPAAIELMADEAEALSPLGYPGPRQATPYFFNYDAISHLAPDHPVKKPNPRQLRQVAYDLIPTESALYRLYHWQPLPDFLADILGYERLYQMTDHYQSLNISIMNDGGCQQWHFDRGVFVTTLLLQESESGGVFEYVPGIREDDNEHFDEVGKVIAGDRSRIRQISIKAGMLNLFKGHYSLHQVTPVQGQQSRIQTALAYAPYPDRKGNLKSSLLHYGPRVAIRAGLTKKQADQLLNSMDS